MAYRLVYNAGEPVTFKELCDKMPTTYRATAATAYREWIASQNLPAPADKWTPAQKDEVWRWWMQRLCTDLRETKRFTATQKGGGKAPNSTARDYWERVAYLPRTAPKVRVVRQDEKLVDWTPDADKHARRYGVGTAFTMEAKKVLDGPRPPSAEIKKLLEMGIEALAID